MIAARDIEDVVDQIAEAFKPERIILFGSYAYGIPNGDSDVDLMVVKRYRGHPADAASRISIAMEHRFPIDIIVRSPAQLRRRLALGDYFISDVVNEGLVLHEKHDARVGQQGRRRLRRRLGNAPIAKAQSL